MNWYYSIAGQQTGPVSEEEFQNLVHAGTIKADTLVWREGMTNWQAYGTLSASGAEPSAPSPMAAPAQPGLTGGYDAGSRTRAEQLVTGPAIGLIVFGAIGLLFSILGAVLNLVGMSGPFMFPRGGGGMDPEVERIMRMFAGPAAVIISTIIGVAVSGLILYGGMQMKKLQSQGLVMASAIAAMIPCVSPCCFIGLPIGIWVLVVLNKPEVKSYFS